MICYQDKVNAGVPQLCTKEKWGELIDSPEVKKICDRIAALDPTAEDYNDRKQALKRRLPIIIPHAASFKNGKRVSTDAIPSGLAMLDVDHVEKPREWWNSRIQSGTTEESLKAEGIFLIAITASGHGLRVIGKREQGESIEAAQMRMAQVLGIKEYDAVTKDLARASYVVPREYILYEDREGLFSTSAYNADTMNEESGRFNRPAKEERLALPAHIPTGEVGLCYRGIPYADIINQLLISTGNCGGAVQGERNTVYFSLAVYMRYICDFNPELLLQILPDFGLSEQERRQAISSAIGRPRKSELPVVVQGAIAICERELEVQSDKVPSTKGKYRKTASGRTR